MDKLKDRIAKLLQQYNMLNLKQDIDWEKFNHYAIVFKEDKSAYYQALSDARDKEEIDIFRQFMYKQYEKMLLLEIRKVNKSKTATIKPDGTGKSGGLSMIF